VTPNFFSARIPGQIYNIPGLYFGSDEDDQDTVVVLFVPVARAHQRADQRNTLPTTMILHGRIEAVSEEIIRPHKADSDPELKRQVAVLRRWRLQLEAGGFIAPWNGAFL
jgi:hypothetical protein